MYIYSIDNGSASDHISHLFRISHCKLIVNILEHVEEERWDRVEKHTHSQWFHLAFIVCMILFNIIHEIYTVCQTNSSHTSRESTKNSADTTASEGAVADTVAAAAAAAAAANPISSDSNFSPGHSVSRHFQRPLMIACAIQPFHNRFDWFF